MTTDRAPSIRERSDRRTLGGFMAVRLVTNTYLRFPYVFIDAIAKGLGVPLTTVTTVLGLRELGGIAGPALGRAVDGGRLRGGLVWSGVVTGTACAAGVLFDSLWWFTALMILGGAARVGVDLSQNVWIGRKVPLEGRGRVVGLVELSWAGAFLIGAPILGWIIQAAGWRAGFVVTGLVLVATTLVTVGADRRVGVSDGSEIIGAAPLEEVSSHAIDGHDHPPRPHTARWAILSFNVFQPIGQMAVFAVNGDWFADRLGMTPAAIGAATLVLGLGELVGTSLVAAVTDRIGAARSAAIGMSVAAPLMATLATDPGRIVVGVALLALMNVAIEFAFVSVLPLMSEMGTEDRGRAFGQALRVNTVSRAVAAIVAGIVYSTGGFGASGLMGMVAMLCGAAVIVAGTTGGDAA